MDQVAYLLHFIMANIADREKEGGQSNETKGRET